MGKHLLTVQGHKIYCEDDRSYRGVKYLAYEMDKEAVKELFQQAEHGREADFEDDEHRHFSLVDGEEGSFNVLATDVDRGWI